MCDVESYVLPDDDVLPGQPPAARPRERADLGAQERHEVERIRSGPAVGSSHGLIGSVVDRRGNPSSAPGHLRRSRWNRHQVLARIDESLQVPHLAGTDNVLRPGRGPIAALEPGDVISAALGREVGAGEIAAAPDFDTLLGTQQ